MRRRGPEGGVEARSLRVRREEETGAETVRWGNWRRRTGDVIEWRLHYEMKRSVLGSMYGWLAGGRRTTLRWLSRLLMRPKF